MQERWQLSSAFPTSSAEEGGEERVTGSFVERNKSHQVDSPGWLAVGSSPLAGDRGLRCTGTACVPYHKQTSRAASAQLSQK